jgi:hypothetical protein
MLVALTPLLEHECGGGLHDTHPDLGDVVDRGIPATILELAYGIHVLGAREEVARRQGGRDLRRHVSGRPHARAFAIQDRVEERCFKCASGRRDEPGVEEEFGGAFR